MISRSLVLLASLSLAACGDDGSDPTAGATTSGGSTSSGPTSDATTSGTTGEDASTGTPTTSTTVDPSSTSTSTSGDSTGGTTGSGSTTGQDVDCDAIPAGPFAPEVVFEGYQGSEDLAFDGAGNLALKQQGQVLLVTSDQQETALAAGFPQVYGTRFAVSGDLLVALPQSGALQAIAPDGTVTDVATGLQSPNGVFVAADGGVWLTEFGGSRVVRFDAQWAKQVVYEGSEAASANGVVLDPARGLLFFTNYGAGRLLQIGVDPDGQPLGDPVEVATIAGAKLDGLALDACGHAYAVDQGNSRLYRVRLDAGGAATGEPEQLAEFAENVANVQFGAGPGFDPESLYAAGNPGVVYRVVVGVPGAPIGLP